LFARIDWLPVLPSNTPSSEIPAKRVSAVVTGWSPGSSPRRCRRWCRRHPLEPADHPMGGEHGPRELPSDRPRRECRELPQEV